MVAAAVVAAVAAAVAAVDVAVEDFHAEPKAEIQTPQNKDSLSASSS